MGRQFSNKRVLITGASKGLGKVAAVAFEKEGAQIALAARSEDKLEALRSSFGDPGKHLVFALDLIDFSNSRKMCSDLISKWEGVDIILHCVGGSLGVNETLTDWEELIKCLKGNVGLACEINRQLVPGMADQGFGNIIHVGSIVGYEARASVPYNSAKAALSGYVRSLGRELAELGIIVSGILPGAFYGEDNAMFRFEYYKPDEYQEFVKSLPRQTIPKADEYVPMLFLLANSESSVMSGSLVSMDGAQGQAYYNFSS